MTKQFFNTREEWLTAGIEEFETLFKGAGYRVPKKIKVSCGWPVGSRGAKRTLGQCFSPEASSGGDIEIFIAPTIDDPVQVLGVTLHEMVHAVIGNEAGHGALFKEAGAAVGLTGAPTKMMPDEDRARWIKKELLPVLGTYPHHKMDTSQRKKQTTRLIKLVCPKTGYTVRTTAKWIEHGLPTSPAGHKMKVAG
jgi:hypothetical protein